MAEELRGLAPPEARRWRGQQKWSPPSWFGNTTVLFKTGPAGAMCGLFHRPEYCCPGESPWVEVCPRAKGHDATRLS